MRYLSVCSGIEAATVAWHDLGWQPIGFSEIEKFPSAVLSHHYPDVTNYGDMTKYKEWNLESVELIVGGTPCQSFSVAGLRKGLEDPRGNLALTYVGLLDHFRPKWFIWENVPGVLSSNGGRDFGSFLGAVAECGYGFSYRVLDAKHFGVPQRRRRVFVVGHLGDWRPTAEVLFERESLPWNIEKSVSPKQRTTASTQGSIGERSQARSPDGSDTIGTLLARDYKGIGNQDLKDGRGLILEPIVYETHPADSRVKEMGDTCQTVTSRWGTGGGNVPLVHSVAVDVYNQSIDGDVCATLTRAVGGTNTSGAKVMQAYSIREDAKANTFNATPLKVTPALQALRPSVQSHHAQTFIAQPMAVRRLTPIECERLQGFPDNYTDIRLKDKDTPDGPRYKAIGNSMAVPCMRWIGKRIEEVKGKI
jgi:DNA (cytosine-5)-methyltransferase 1